MDASIYQERCADTAVYPGQGEALGLSYCSMGLAGGAGAVNNLVKKCIRDDGIGVTPERKAQIRHAMGEADWYLSQLANELGIDRSEVMEENLALLAGRQERGVLHGDGADR